MRPIFRIAVFITLFLGPFSTPANASNDYSKCPDTWILTSTDDSVLQKELMEAKSILGTNLAVSIISREIQDSGTWKVFATEKISNAGDLSWIPLLQLPMRTNFKVEVKGCPAPLNISSPFSRGNPQIVRSSYSTLYEDVLKILPQNTSLIKNLNFKQVEDSINTLKVAVESNQRDLLSGQNNSVRGRFKYLVAGKSRESVLFSLKPIADQYLSGAFAYFHLLPESLDCVVLGPDVLSPQNRSFTLIPPGTKCEYQFVYVMYNGTNYPQGVIFQIDSVVIQTATTEVNCIKGKLTKKIYGINPKCPSGYKRK